MDLSGQASQARFASYVEALVEVIGHAGHADSDTSASQRIREGGPAIASLKFWS
jgi:hypothetical protein